MYSPGRVYLHNDSNNPTAVVENWIANYERTRQIFVFPVSGLRNFAYMFLTLGVIYLALQISLFAIAHIFVRTVFILGLVSGILCVLAGGAGLYAAKRCTNAGLIDFMVFTLLLNIVSVLAVLSNAFNMDFMCNVDGAKHYIGECSTSVLVLQSIITFLNGIFFIVSSLALGYVSRTMEYSVQLQIPPLVIYCSSTPITEAIRTEEQQASLLKRGETQQPTAATRESGESSQQDIREATRGDIPST